VEGYTTGEVTIKVTYLLLSDFATLV
jgi:hypothetical protein